MSIGEMEKKDRSVKDAARLVAFGSDSVTRRRDLLAMGAGALFGTGLGQGLAQPVSTIPQLPAFNLRTALAAEQVLAPLTTWAAADAIRKLANSGTPFSILSSGHCYEGLSQSDGTVLDLRGMAGVRVDASRRLLQAGPGATLGAINQATAPHGLVLPAGYCQTVALGGHVGGGGIGILSRAYGLLCDHLLSAQVVLASGKVVTASEADHPDLFWALRGGGSGSFGLIAAMQFVLRTPPPVTMTEFVLRLPLAEAAEWLAAWMNTAGAAEPEIGFFLYLDNLDAKRVTLLARSFSILSEPSATESVRGMAALGSSNAKPHITTGSYSEISDRLWPQGVYPSRALKIAAEMFDAPLSASSLYKLLEVFAENRRFGLQISFEALGGRIDDVPAGATAYPHRASAQFLAMAETYLPPGAAVPERVAALRRLQSVLQPHATGRSYINYPDKNRPGWDEAYFGESLDRLMSVKRTYDPHNVFRHALSIPLNRP